MKYNKLLELTLYNKATLGKGVNSMSSAGSNQNGAGGQQGTVNPPTDAGWEDFKRFYKNYVAAIAVVKDTLDVLWKLAPIGLIMPAILIWSYLKKIGWQQLFQESVVSVPGLIVMIVSACLLTFVLAVQFCVPSIISVGAAGFYDEQSKVAKASGVLSIRNPIACLFVFSPVVWLGTAGALALIADLSGGWTFLVSIGVMVLFEAAVIYRWRNSLSDPSKSGFVSVLGHWLKLMVAPTCAALPVSLSLFICLGVFSSGKMSNWAAFGVFFACIIYSVIGVLPGMVYLFEKISDKKPFDIFKTTTVAGVMVFYVLWIVALTLGPVTSTILRSIGAIDESRYVFQVLKPDLVTGMQGAGFTVHMVAQSPYSKDVPAYFVDSYVRFNFASVLLLCRDPLAFSKADGGSMTDKDVQSKNLIWRAGGYFCVKARADEVRLLQSLHT
ncbi:hypothetical protein [Burkholderia contaminans]|uniref:hypothetical protein n=1 Tax=Burkholderia contaminans TaxID=488447 RepID=UPI000F56E919|nr:hypothetical protein [Burkholderia contaminans]